MSGKERRSDGLLGERGNERRRALHAPPVLHATALLLDYTPQAMMAAVLLSMSLRPSSSDKMRSPISTS